MATTLEQAVQQAHEAAQRAAGAADTAKQAYEQALQIAGGGGGGAVDAIAHGAAAVTGVDPFIYRLAIFVLAIFVGYYVVWAVTPALHTPLMSVTNAISSVIIVGALVAAGVHIGASGEGSWATRIFGFIAVALASVNIFGGFMVTERMLAMYKKKQ